MKLIRKLKTKVTTGIHNYTGYLLATTHEQRRAQRKHNRAQKRAKHLKGLRDFKPFNWGILRKWQERSQRRADNAQLTVVQ